MKLAVFIDYDNLLEAHKVSGILDITSRALLQTPLTSSDVRGTCEIRVYGGWYEGLTMTSLAQSVAVSMQSEFPTIIRLPRNNAPSVSLSTTAELAVAMMEEPGHHLFNTYRKKARPRNVRVQKPDAIGCVEAACPLPSAKMLLKTGTCPVSTCTVAAVDLVYRHEQKIVDTMLTCDLIYSTHLSYDCVILVSGDDDFLPPVRTVLLRGTPVARFNPQPSRTRTPFPSVGGKLTDIDL